MNDGKALGAWLEQHASALSRQQAGYYKEVMGDEPWNPAYAITNGLLHPQNAALLANYAAGVEVGKPGVATVSPEEVLAVHEERFDQIGRLRRGGLI